MADLLFLCQRLPYPPTKGEKIRAFHELKHLARHYDVHLGCLVDDPTDLDHVDALRPLCRDIHVAPINPKLAKLTCLTGLLTNEGLSVTYFRQRSLQSWVQRVLSTAKPAVTFVYSSNMAPYVLGCSDVGRLIADIVDVDSEKWRALAETTQGPMRHVYRREWHKIAALEAQVVHASERALLVSKAEAALLARLVPVGTDRIQGISNGVDHRYFDPSGFTDAQPGDAPEFVFTGTMDYPPNADAVAWFANAILPLIRQVEPQARFTIVGANPSRETQGLANQNGVTVTGRVPDVRPFLARATAAVAPMRIARGIQNKVLEAMAMARPVVLTSGALEGIDATPGQDVLLADTEQDFADACLGLVQGNHPGIGPSARARILQDYDWDTCLAALDTLLRPGEATTSETMASGTTVGETKNAYGMTKSETDLSQFDRQYNFPREDVVGITKSELRRLALPLGGGLLLWGLIFHQEVVAAVRQWESSTAYNHCFLVLPIIFYLLWDRKEDLMGICARPTWKVLPLGIPLAVAWLAAERLGIMEGRQLIAITFLQLLFFSLFGFEFWRRMVGPLLYLYFLVPFGEFLTPRLQDVTTDFVRHGLQFLNIPAYIDGYIIQIPQGTFFIAEACAGLRFLIASIAFGCLYAILMYRSPVRRGVFILVSIIVPIIANGFRALGIVYLGYLLGSAQAAAADHIIYGWIFFSTVILILIALGLPFRQDDLPYRKPGMWEGWLVGRLPFQMPMMFINSAAVIVMAAIGPLIAWGLSSAAAAQPALAGRFDLGPDCTTATAPAQAGASTLRVTCGDAMMDLAWTTFSPRATAGVVMAQRRRMVMGALTEGLLEHWMPDVDGHPSPWHLMESNDPDFMTAVAVWVEGRPVRPGMQMRLHMALDSVTGTARVPVVMTVTPVVDWDSLSPAGREAADAGLKAFISNHPNLADQVSALSAVK